MLFFLCAFVFVCVFREQLDSALLAELSSITDSPAQPEKNLHGIHGNGRAPSCYSTPRSPGKAAHNENFNLRCFTVSHNISITVNSKCFDLPIAGGDGSDLSKVLISIRRAGPGPHIALCCRVVIHAFCSHDI